jgi:hypothetical protein
MKLCPWCGKEVIGTERKVYCSEYCQQKAWRERNRKYINEQRARYTLRQPEYQRRYALRHPGAAAGSSGYRRFGITNCGNHSSLVRRMVRTYFVQEGLGRLLLDTEVVHHIDQDPRNNDPLNWWIFDSLREHSTFHAMLRREV